MEARATSKTESFVTMSVAPGLAGLTARTWPQWPPRVCWTLKNIRGKRIASDTKPGESSRYAERERTKANDMSKNKAKTVEEFDRRFDEGESIFELAEVTSVSRPNLEVQRVNVDFPKHFLQKLYREAELRGVSRQALIKTWLYERLQFATAGNVVGISRAMRN